jgi:hypothetical protein
MEATVISDLNFKQFLQQGKLMGSRCNRCDLSYVPPRPVCPQCHGSDLEWREMPTRGRLAAFTCVAVPPPAMVAQGYGRDNPYCTGVIELDAGGRVVARIELVDAARPEAIQVGTPMEAVFHSFGSEEQTPLAFVPVQE